VPAWVDRTLYPYTPRAFATPEGTMRYVDVGCGPAVVLVHGTPTWSFLYRALIARLARSHRVVAVDHLGFGLSDKPADAGYRPEDHARRLAAVIGSLELSDVALVVHDFGGPIGLAYALQHPERVRQLVIFNSWLWSLEDDRRVVQGARLSAGPLGRFLYRRLNCSPRWLVPLLMAAASGSHGPRTRTTCGPSRRRRRGTGRGRWRGPSRAPRTGTRASGHSASGCRAARCCSSGGCGTRRSGPRR
jgi:haloalkane dehalogenase